MDPIVKDFFTILTPILALCLSIYLAIRGNSEKSAASLTELSVKLENIQSGISDIKSDMRSTKESINEIRERLTVVEQSTKQAHKRLDELEQEIHQKEGLR